MSLCRLNINDLPPQIIIDILSRLPTKTVIHCRCVCKTWQNLVLDPYFTELHLSRSPTNLIIHQNYHQDDALDFLHCDVLLLVEFDHDHRRLHCDAAMQVDLRTTCYPNGHIRLVDSINGLVCFCDYKNEVVHITNPIMREYVTLPKPTYSRRSPDLAVVYGFGFGTVSGSYKVAQIFQRRVSGPAAYAEPRRYETRVEVYTLGTTGKWRSIDIGTSTLDFSYKHHYHNLTSPIFLNGNIHWLVFSGGNDDVVAISCFDVEEESFQTISAPPSKGNAVYKSLVVLEGCLCVCHNSKDSDLSIWVMKEYGVESSWTKQTVITKDVIRKQSSDFGAFWWLAGAAVVSPIKIWGNGDYLILWREDFMYNYNPEGETLEEVQIPLNWNADDVPLFVNEVRLHVASFRSLRDLVMTTEKVEMSCPLLYVED